MRAAFALAAAPRALAPAPPGLHTPPPSSHALLSTRQGAAAFNQPVSFDTSRVMTMSYMFLVRSAARTLPQ